MTEPFHATGLHFECQRCGYCCSAACGRSYVYLSGTDRQRLAAHLGMPLPEFARRYLIYLDGAFYMSATGVDCPFLRENSCSVHVARPTQCRTWPFWAENMSSEAWRREAEIFCPGIGKGRRYLHEEIEALLGQAED